MFDRQEVKVKGREAFKRNYWPSVLAGLAAAIGGASAGGSTSGPSNAASQNQDPNWLMIFLVLAAGIALAVFVGNMLSLGSQNFFLKNRKENAAAEEILFGFQEPYINKVKVIFFTAIRIALWTLLFIIPGIIKAYEYRLVGYIVAENPYMETKDAIKMSSDLMNGNKWKAFVYDLSFIGWIILAMLTFGLVGIFYLQPFKGAADAELYAALAGIDNNTEMEPVAE